VKAPTPDLRLLLATFALVLGASWLDTVERVLSHNPAIAGQIRARLLTTEPPPPPVEAVSDTAEPWSDDEAWPPVERTIRVDAL
jgi:hypothetical protein